MTSRPRLLDLFCGAGGAAMGYHRVGFHVTGVDIAPQRHYPFPFVQADALEYVAEHGREYDAIHASPPCQHYSRLRHLPWLRYRVYWRSIPPTREVLQGTGIPWVIENVEDAGWDMVNPVRLCGRQFGLPLFRHRLFEASHMLLVPPHATHDMVITPGRASLGTREHGLNARNGGAGHQGGVARHRENMGIDWMTGDEMAQAIPPVYTTLIGRQLLTAVGGMHGDTRVRAGRPDAG